MSTRHTSKSEAYGTTISCRGTGLVGPRDVAGAKAFFRNAIKRQPRPPQTITLNGYAASHRAARELKADGSLLPEAKLRSSKYVNDVIDQDHRYIK